MNLETVQPFIGMSYNKNFDCADFAIHVARELFGKTVTLPGERPRGAGCEAALPDASRAYGVPTDDPTDGDIILLYDMGDAIGSPSHVGVRVSIGNAVYCLHNGKKLGGSVATRLDGLSRLGLTIEGYYKWII